MQYANAILETTLDVNLPPGSYFGNWNDNVIQFKVDNMENLCELPTRDTCKGAKQVLVVIWENLAYIFERKDLA